MRLKQLIANIAVKKIFNFKNLDISGICADSRYIKEKEIFVAVSGAEFDGHDFLDESLRAGAIALVVDVKKIPYSLDRDRDIVIIAVADTRDAIISLAAKFYKTKLKGLKLIGVTGTNGKTTVAYLLESILQSGGYKTGLIGTIDYHLPGRKQASFNTTPSLLELYRYFLEMKKANISYCIMEVSSHALDQERVGGLHFHRAIFTNLTRDHLDYHRNFQNYFAAKRKLFSKFLGPKACAIINSDDPFGRRLLRMKLIAKLSYGLQRHSQVRGSDIRLNTSQTKFCSTYKRRTLTIDSKLLGVHNVYNILAATATCLSLNISSRDIIKGIKRLKEVAGRLELIARKKGIKIFIDYAHTPAALKEVLHSLKCLIKEKARIILVFGCGGERDKIKRPQMGKIASLLADLTILTTDNPRSEDPRQITKDISKGFFKKNFMIVENRYKAIKKAIAWARDEDIVLIAGKGHERMQIFNNVSVDFDDSEVVKRVLKGD